MKWMIFLLTAISGLAQTIDFSSLDKLASKASSVNRISLDGPQIRAAINMLGTGKAGSHDIDQLKSLAAGLTSITVHSYEFKAKGQYTDADLAPIRRQLTNMKNASKVVDSKEDGEHSEIFMINDGDKPAGLAVIAAEETELSVVVLKGSVSLASLGSLGALAGVPSMQMKPDDHAKPGK
jgi:hypothetical protein